MDLFLYDIGLRHERVNIEHIASVSADSNDQTLLHRPTQPCLIWPQAIFTFLSIPNSKK